MVMVFFVLDDVDSADALLCHICLPVCLWIMDPHSIAAKKNVYELWKRGATARYYAAHTMAMLPARESVPRSSMLVNHGPSQQSSKEECSHGNELLPQDTTYLMQRPCYQRRSPCQDPTGNQTTRRPPDHRKETQTAVVWLCFPFIGSGQNHLAWYSEKGKKTRQTEEEVGRQQGMDRPGVRQVPEGSREQRKMWETGSGWCPIDPRG